MVVIPSFLWFLFYRIRLVIRSEGLSVYYLWFLYSYPTTSGGAAVRCLFGLDFRDDRQRNTTIFIIATIANIDLQ